MARGTLIFFDFITTLGAFIPRTPFLVKIKEHLWI
jgi:hypothetical protein